VGSYYYLVAQLPSLSYGAPAPMSSGRLRELCAELMAEDDAALLNRCVLVPDPSPTETPTGSPLIDAWLAWERAVRLNLARARAGRLKRDAATLPEAPADPIDAAAVTKNVLAVESPLEAEQSLDRARWAAIESFLGFDYFGRDTVYAYLLKLLILERKALFRVEEGFAEYKAIYASVMEAAPTSIESGEPK
jgi:hypothetical protein